MEHFCCECLTFGNIVLVFVFLLILNQLIELYEFRNMPPGPRLTSLPLIVNLLSFDSLAPGGSFMDATKRFVFSFNLSTCMSLTLFWVRFFKKFKVMWVLRGVRSQQLPSTVAPSRSCLSCSYGPFITLEMKMMYCLHDFLLLLWSLRKNYGSLYSLKLGSYKFVIAEDVASVKEVLVKKSADYAGRPPFHSFLKSSMGRCLGLCQ